MTAQASHQSSQTASAVSPLGFSCPKCGAGVGSMFQRSMQTDEGREEQIVCRLCGAIAAARAVLVAARRDLSGVSGRMHAEVSAEAKAEQLRSRMESMEANRTPCPVKGCVSFCWVSTATNPHRFCADHNRALLVWQRSSRITPPPVALVEGVWTARAAIKNPGLGCSFPGCKRKHNAKGLCKMHYNESLKVSR